MGNLLSRMLSVRKAVEGSLIYVETGYEKSIVEVVEENNVSIQNGIAKADIRAQSCHAGSPRLPGCPLKIIPECLH